MVRKEHTGFIKSINQDLNMRKMKPFEEFASQRGGKKGSEILKKIGLIAFLKSETIRVKSILRSWLVLLYFPDEKMEARMEE